MLDLMKEIVMSTPAISVVIPVYNIEPDYLIFPDPDDWWEPDPTVCLR